MFEKEAEEYAEKTIENWNYRFSDEIEHKVKRIWQDGAEFAYNKASEEFAKKLKEIVETCNHWQEVAEKANEWHYVKDELPDHNGEFYVALKGQTETFILNYDYDEYDESKMVWLDDDDTNFDDEVYAWREKHKAPKESE